MKSGATIVVLFSLFLLSVDGHATTRGWKFGDVSLSLPTAHNTRKDGSLLRSNNEILCKTPPSQEQVALKIERLHEIKNFSINGWLVVFLPIRIDLNKMQIVFRALAERTGNARYSYRVSESQGASADIVIITVEQPVLLNACADGTESNDGYCDDGSSPR